MRMLIPALLAALATPAVANPPPLARRLQAMCGDKQPARLVLVTGAQRLAVAEALAGRLQAPLQKVVAHTQDGIWDYSTTKAQQTYLNKVL